MSLVSCNLTHVGINVVALCVTRWNEWMVLFYTQVMVGVHVLRSLDIIGSVASIRACAKHQVHTPCVGKNHHMTKYWTPFTWKCALILTWKKNKSMANTIIWDSWSWVGHLTTSLYHNPDIDFHLSIEVDFNKLVVVVSRLSYFTLTFLMMQYSCYSNLAQSFPNVGFISFFQPFSI